MDSYTNDVQFEGDTPIAAGSAIGIVKAENKMAEWLMRKGIAKSEPQAQAILLAVAAAAIIMAVVSWVMLNSHQQPAAPAFTAEHPAPFP